MEEAVMNFENAGFETDLGDAEQDVSVAELLGVEQQQEPEASVNEEGGDGQQTEAQADGQEDEQAKLSRIFAKMERNIRASMQKKFDADPINVFARRLVGYYADSNNLSQEDALGFAENHLLQAIASKENVSPYAARRLFQNDQPRVKEETFEEKVERRGRELEEEIPSMTMPEGFDFNKAIKEKAFAEMLMEMPTEAAIRIYHAEQKAAAAEERAKQAEEKAAADMAERLRSRSAIPQPMRPQQPVTPNINFDNMTDEQFFEFERSMKG